ncbi:class F sortase [Actinoplanes sp. NPDC049265]|uniref:class F sortase n=1 Tax=Actinoplanes sp. NPDC049265 TaxID=3363902 RepID=UPI003717D06E
MILFDRRSGTALFAFVLAVAGGNLLTAGLSRPAPPPVAVTAPKAVAALGSKKAEPGLPRSEPVRLTIPAIEVDTAVMRLGLERDGTMQVPPLTRDAPAGWYRHLPTPGENGPAVIVGHVDTTRYGAGVFYRLGTLRAGDTVGVRRADGRTAAFRVVSVAQYSKADFPAADVYGPTGRPALRLITCGGDLDRRRGHYRDSVVVYAVLNEATRPDRT